MKKLILLFAILFSLNTFARKSCDNGVIYFKQKEEKIYIALVKDGEILPCINHSNDFIFKYLHSFYRSKNQKIKLNYNSKVESTLIETKSTIILCYESFIEQVTPFLKNEVNQVTLISQQEIPFLTFLKLE